MKERPILFTGDMVNAILEGRKTQTRRVVKPQPLLSRYGWCYTKSGKVTNYGAMLGGIEHAGWDEGKNPVSCMDKFSKYNVGDMLYVRETWTEVLTKPFDLESGKIVYRADGWEASNPDYPVKWKSPYHMFKKDARIWLEVKDVRVERLQDITAEDIIKEGAWRWEWSTDMDCSEVYEAWMELWDSINKNRGYGWESNPWVWVIEFEMTPNYTGEK